MDQETLLFQSLETIKDLEKRIEELEDNMSKLVPDNDYTGYAEMRKVWLERELRRAKIWDAIIEKSTSGLVWGFMLWAGTALYTYLKQEIKK